MALASSLIEDVARYLSDYDEDESYVHWTREDLFSYFRRAVGIVAVTKREKFTKRTEISLVEGAIQDVPDLCDSDIKVIGLADEDGVVQDRPRKASLSKFPTLGRPRCSVKFDSNEYKLSSYDIDSDNPRQIIVDPPVQKGATGTLVISCYQPPKVTGDDVDVALDGELEAAVFELMLYYAWGVDIEDTASRERSNAHWANAMTLLKLNVDMQLLAKRLSR